MADDPRLAYVQARVQARHGERPDADDWRAAEASADLAHYLEALKRTGLQRWVADLAPEMAPEALERELRGAWLACVDEKARWSPERWRPAVAWLRWLPYLPAIDHLLGPRKIPPWMRADPVLRPLAVEEPARRRQALGEGPLAALDPGDAGEVRVVAAWLGEWRRRLPDGGEGQGAALERLAGRVLEHLEAVRGATGSANAARLALREELVRALRRQAGGMAAVFAHLGIAGLDLERARAGIMARRLLPDRAEGRTWA